MLRHMGFRWDDWVHAMWSARGQWLPGDARGFRNHGHRVHSSGDVRNPPPDNEHAGLRTYAKSITRRVVFLPNDVRPRLVSALVEKFEMLRVPVRVIAVDGVHAHALVQLGIADAKPLVARAKQHSSFQVRDRLQGSIWAESCHPVRIEDEGHWRATVEYIHAHRERGACVWEPPQLAAQRDTRA